MDLIAETSCSLSIHSRKFDSWNCPVCKRGNRNIFELLKHNPSLSLRQESVQLLVVIVLQVLLVMNEE